MKLYSSIGMVKGVERKAVNYQYIHNKKNSIALAANKELALEKRPTVCQEIKCNLVSYFYTKPEYYSSS